MDPAVGTVEAIAIVGDTIVAVGSAHQIAQYAGADTLVVDLAGRTIIPGFVDAHTHVLFEMGGLAEGQRLALENGITTVGDAYVNSERVDAYVAAAESGELRVRASMYLVRTDACGTDQDLWYEEYPPDEAFGDRLRVAGVKIFADGGTCGPLGASEPFLQGVEVSAPFHDLDTLTSYITDADDGGYQVLVHAQGDLAVANVQDAYASVLAGDENLLRHRIDHNALVTEDIVSRYNALGLVVVLFGTSEACAPDAPWTDFYKENGEEPAEIVAANPDVVFAWHGDDPWIVPVSPMGELFGLVTRGAVAEDGSTCEPAPWMVDEGVTVGQGLAMMTTGSAYALRQEGVVGSLTPARLADVVVLSDNPLTVAAGELADIDVLMTMIGGVTEFCRGGAEAWCPGWAIPEVPAATASASRPEHGSELVLDGSVSGESFWSSGADATQWIRVDLPQPTTVSSIRFVVYQNPPSDTIHELEVMVDGEWTPAETFIGFTTTGDVLMWDPLPDFGAIEAIRMTTLESLSWPEWYEVEIVASG
jgi:predicted amidohydrolase YtcJ